MKKILYGIVCLIFVLSFEQNMEARGGDRYSQWKNDQTVRENRRFRRDRRKLKDKEEQESAVEGIRHIGQNYDPEDFDIDKGGIVVENEDSLEEFLDEIEVDFKAATVRERKAFKAASKKARDRRKEGRKVKRVEDFFTFDQDEFDALS